jgi:hypothetical protein
MKKRGIISTMKNIIALAALAAQAAFPVAALAVTVNYGGGSINVDDVQVQVTPGSINVQTGTGAGTGTNVQVNTSTGGLQVQTSGSTIRLYDSTGTAVSVGTGSGNLNVVVSGGLDANSRTAIVSLEGNTDLLIKTDADLAAYNALVVQERASIAGVETGADGSVSVRYRQPARFLGLVNTRIVGTVDVTPAGRVIVKLPWYSFLFTKNTAAVQTAVQSDVDVAVGKKQITVGAGVGTGTSVSVQNDARTINVVTSSIDSSVGVSIQ